MERPPTNRHRIRHSQCTQRAAPTRTTKAKRPRHSHMRAARPTEYPHGESNFCRILGRYRSRGKFRTTFRTTLGGPRSRRPGSTPRGSPGWSTPGPREPDAARRRRLIGFGRCCVTSASGKATATQPFPSWAFPSWGPFRRRRVAVIRHGRRRFAPEIRAGRRTCRDRKGKDR